MIVKNEEENIRKALAWGKGIVCEQIVVDTGSTDRTVELAKEMGAQVFHYSWKNDFADAKNFALQKAYGDWIIFLDADEYFLPEDVGKIEKYLEAIDSMKISKGKEKGSIVECAWINIDRQKNIINILKQTRIFRNRKYIRYVGKIHEQIEDLRGKGLTLVDLTKELKIYHTGYDKEVYQRTNKLERNISLLEESLKENPNSAVLQLYMAESQSAKGNVELAMKYVTEAVKNSDCSLEKERLLGAHQMRLYQSLTVKDTMKIKKEDVMQMYEEALQIDSTYPDFDIALAYWYKEWNEPVYVIRYLLKALEKAEYCENLSYSRITEFIGNVYYLLATCCYELGEWQGVVEYATQYLKINLYDGEILGILLNLFCNTAQESVEEIIHYLGKLYNLNDANDNQFVCEVAKENNCHELHKKLQNS